MIPNLGDYTTSETIYVPFHTFDSNGASVTLTGLAVTDIEIYKDGSVTQRSSDAGYTLLDTDGIDFDGTTGIHGFSIDLSDNTDAGFYADGSQYWIVVSSVTVDSQTVNFVAGTFTIGRLLRPTTAGRTLDVAATGEAGVDLGNVTGTLTNANVAALDANERVDIGQVNGDTDAATRLALSAAQIIPFTVDTVTNTHTPTTTEFQADDITEATTSHFNGRIVIFTTGALAGQATDISAYSQVGGIGQFTVTAMTEAPADNDTGVIV